MGDKYWDSIPFSEKVRFLVALMENANTNGNPFSDNDFATIKSIYEVVKDDSYTKSIPSNWVTFMKETWDKAINLQPDDIVIDAIKTIIDHANNG